MIGKINGLLKGVSLQNEKGRFLSDKSYAYDDIYFMSKYILANLDTTCTFNKKKHHDSFVKYTVDIFQLRKNTSVAQNYMNEAINVLEFSGLLQKKDSDSFFVVDLEILKYISSKIENAYIFLYLVVYNTFLNDGISNDYKEFVEAASNKTKTIYLDKIYNSFKEKSVSIGGRKGANTNWSKQLVKYAMIVLNFANETNYISRALKIKDRFVEKKDIAINVEGTRTPQFLPKKNGYVLKFDDKYIRNHLKDFLFISYEIDSNINNSENLTDSLADLKIDILKANDETDTTSDKFEQEQFINTEIKTRNSNVQRVFRDGLLKNNTHICPICGFEYKDFLIASHIIPYSKCEDTYDAINHFNGLLLCPNHDKLFEGSKHMTIKYDTGKIVLSNEMQQTKDYGYLDGKIIDKSLILSERRHYLKKHNDMFEHNQSNEV